MPNSPKIIVAAGAIAINTAALVAYYWLDISRTIITVIVIVLRGVVYST